MDNKDKINNNIYIELDSIIDSRLSLLYDIDKELIERLIKDDKYKHRYKDEYNYIHPAVFRKIYENRDKSILKNATPTNIVNLLKEYKLSATEINFNFGKDEKTKVYLNIYPYTLFDTEIDMLKRGLKVIFGTEFEIEIVNMNENDLSPKWIDDNVGVMVKYDGMEWLNREITIKRILKNPIPDVGLILPAIVLNDLVVNNKTVDKFFEDTIKTMSPYISLHFIPVADFSIYTEKK